MSRFLKRILVFIFLFCFIVPLQVKAQEQEQYFRTDYNVEYFLESKQTQKLYTSVRYNITVTNLHSDTYVSKFLLSIPRTFTITNLKASDEKGSITPVVQTTDSGYQIELGLNNPETGKQSANKIILEFEQANLFKINGNVWEVILPAIQSNEGDSYNIVVNLPTESAKRVSIAKPKPDLIQGNKIYWNNPKSKIIYAVFGSAQYYELNLRYNLENPRLTPVYTDIAFPPDTLYQKTYVSTINPLPTKVYTDNDGNYIGRYVLNPNEKKTVIYTGTSELFIQPRDEVRESIRKMYNSQKKYLLTAQSNWQIDKPEKLSNLKSPQQVYDYVVKTLSYDYSKVSKNTKRLGANKALMIPAQAVCTEFSDVFVAVARENGVPSREIEGYGFSSDERFRPLSLLSDVLHSWPEYYDETRGLWIPVDPTWENTSGIDYFSSFDLNHIVFAIHGKQSDYPYPAGMYKIQDSRDIDIQVAEYQPTAVAKITTMPIPAEGRINFKDTYKSKVTVKNSGNTYVWNLPVEIESNNLEILPDKTTILTLAPLEEREVQFEYKAKNKGLQTQAQIKVRIANTQVESKKIKIGRFTAINWYKLAGIAVIACVAVFLLRRRASSA